MIFAGRDLFHYAAGLREVALSLHSLHMPLRLSLACVPQPADGCAAAPPRRVSEAGKQLLHRMNDTAPLGTILATEGFLRQAGMLSWDACRLTYGATIGLYMDAEPATASAEQASAAGIDTFQPPQLAGLAAKQQQPLPANGKEQEDGCHAGQTMHEDLPASSLQAIAQARSAAAEHSASSQPCCRLARSMPPATSDPSCAAANNDQCASQAPASTTQTWREAAPASRAAPNNGAQAASKPAAHAQAGGASFAMETRFRHHWQRTLLCQDVTFMIIATIAQLAWLTRDDRMPSLLCMTAMMGVVLWNGLMIVAWKLLRRHYLQYRCADSLRARKL